MGFLFVPSFSRFFSGPLPGLALDNLVLKPEEVHDSFDHFVP